MKEVEATSPGHPAGGSGRGAWSFGSPAWRIARDAVGSLALLGLALFLAIASESAARRGDRSLAILLSLLALASAAIIATTVVPRLLRKIEWRLPFFFRVTRSGAVYLLLVLVLSVAAINTGNNLLFLLLAALLAAIVISGVVARASLRDVSVAVQVPENVFEGERVCLKVTLRNEKRLSASFSLSVEDSNRGSRPSGSAWRLRWRKRRPATREEVPPVLRQPAYFPVIPARETRSELVFQSFPRRGRYRLDGFRIATRFPFGFFERGEMVPAHGEIIVYPSIREVSAFFHLLPFLPGRLEGMRMGPGENLYAIRKYQAGESARAVDWKATAKTGELMARDYAREEESKFCLILDTMIHAREGKSYELEFEKAVALAASLASHFSEEGAEMEFLSPDEYVPRGAGEPQLYRILRSLALAESRPASGRAGQDLKEELSGLMRAQELRQILSDKIFKIILTSRPRGSFASSVWRSSHVVYFDEL